MTVQAISKSQLKAQLFTYLRQVEHEQQSLIITHAGEPVLKIAPYQEDPQHLLHALRGSVISYVHPTDPVAKDRKAGETHRL